jgi:Cu+-exporting ATPase
MTSKNEERMPSPPRKKETRENKNAARLIISVGEMSCTVCASAIEKEVKKIPGIKDVKPAIMLNKVFIDYDPKLADTAKIREALKKAGFKSSTVVESH